MRRRWWHTLIVALSITVIFGVGVTAIWGPDVRGWFDTASKTDADSRPVAEPAGPGGVL
jgi:hypothetical protein